MADPVEPVDLTADPAHVEPERRLDFAIDCLAERVQAMEDERDAALATTRRSNRLYTFMAAGAIIALSLFLLLERLPRGGREMSWNAGRSYSRLDSRASAKARSKFQSAEAEEAARSAAYAQGQTMGDDEAARGWPCNALVPPSITTPALRDAWQAGYVKGYNARKASGSVLPIRV